MPQIAQTFPYFFLNQGKRRQAVINGNMDIWQRGTPLNAISTLDYTADRWTHYFDGWGGDLNVSKVEVPSAYTEVRRDCQYAMKMEYTAGWTGQTINRFYYLIPDVHYSNGEIMSIGFWMWANRAITLPSFKLRQKFGIGGSPSGTVTIPITTNISVDTTPRYYQFQVIPASTAGKVIGTSADDCLSIDLYMPLNEEFTVYTTGWVINTGDAVLPIVKKSYEETINECYTFYKRFKVLPGNVLAFGQVREADKATAIIYYPKMRLNPPKLTMSTAAYWRVEKGGSLYSVSSITTSLIDDQHVEIVFNTTGGVLAVGDVVAIRASTDAGYRVVDIQAEF
ncbi:MAG: hypothetical protein WC372_08750 [Candidatus Neomarinimicrobiota bacterium]|jgi:hypothetical protein